MSNQQDVRPAFATASELRERALHLLEFPKIREALAEHTQSPLSRERALALRPAYDADAVAELQQETAEAEVLLDSSTGLALSHDPRPLLHRAAIGGVLAGNELAAVADALDVTHGAKTLGGQERARTPLLRSLTRNIADLRPLERELRGKLTPSGELKDDASPLLRRLRRESRDSYQAAAASVQSFVDSELGAQVLQDRLFTVRGERLVLPVKADFRGRAPGIVHGTSDSGATLFIEPFSSVASTNRWREATDAEQEEVLRILRLLSASVGRRATEALHALEITARLDTALAKARYARTYHGVTSGGHTAGVSLVEARHPLLGGRAVPLSLTLEAPATTLVVTGPNTGGKTVALKTLGLMALMRQSGMMLPCSPTSTLPVFDGVYADIGDQQSIENAVSTFSSHAAAIAGILTHATTGSLVLLDEIGTSTDPEEGAALAQAVVAHLADRGISSLVTTHHRPLAAFTEEHERVENASVELDPQTLRPTYKLTMGLPGRSYAMAIAASVGLDARVIEAAQRYLGPEHHRTETLLATIQQERHVTRAKLDEAEAERGKAEQLSAELEQQLEALAAAQATAIADVKAELREEARRVQVKLRQAESAAEWQAFRGEPPPPRVIEAAAESVEDVQRSLSARAWGKRPESTGRRPKPVVGDMVEIGELGFTGTVVNGPDASGRVEVLVGSARLKLDPSRLRRTGEQETGREGRSSITLAQPASGVGLSGEVNLRGLRVDEALERLDAYLDSALASGLSQVRIVHGKGTGALRSAVWRHLAGNRSIATYSQAPRERGGDGATEVQLGNL